MRDIFRRGTDDRQGRAQFVRDRGDEIHLQLGKPLRSRAGDDQDRHADDQQEKNPKADRQIAAVRIRHEGSQRSTSDPAERLPTTAPI